MSGEKQAEDPVIRGSSRACEQYRLLKLVPEPTRPVYEAPSHSALIRAGISEETIAIVEEANRATVGL